jgi:death on curing protein
MSHGGSTARTAGTWLFLAIHSVAAPGDSTIRDAGAIQAALWRPQAMAFGADGYPDVWEKAAALMQSLARNHGFVNGNKRAAWAVTMTFLEVNGHPLDPHFDQPAAEEFVVAVAVGRYADVASIASELVKLAL